MYIGMYVYNKRKIDYVFNIVIVIVNLVENILA